MLLEAYTMTRPYSPPLLINIVNPVLTMIPSQMPLLPFQMLALARKITLTISIAFSQLGPYFQGASGQTHISVDLARLARLEQLAQSNEAEATRSLRMEMTPYIEDETSTKELKAGIRDWLVQNTVRADPLVRHALSSIAAKQSQDQPPASDT